MARHSDAGTQCVLNIHSLAMYSSSASLYFVHWAFCAVGFFVCFVFWLFIFLLVCLFNIVEQSKLTLNYLGLKQDCRQGQTQPRIAYTRDSPFRNLSVLILFSFSLFFALFRFDHAKVILWKRNAWKSMLSSCYVPFSTKSNVMYSKVRYIFCTKISLLDIVEIVELQRLWLAVTRILV